MLLNPLFQGKLVVVPVPDKLQIEAEHYSEELSGGIVAPQYEEWVDALQDEGIVVVDAVEEFLEKNEETPMFEAYESHYTSAGRQVLAQMIADTINEEFQSFLPWLLYHFRQ